ncbi:MAG: hypothetical protein JSW27_22930 [Phycisphaerales bacterium]|nr:MAG: hypothetical protein JSW27_22930 [Phycisphaerales bacterium]
MDKRTWAAATVLVVLAGVLLLALRLSRQSESAGESNTTEEATLRHTIAEMREQLRQAQSDRDTAQQRIKSLQLELSNLSDARREDGEVIRDLWAMVTAEEPESRRNAQSAEPSKVASEHDETIPPRDQNTPTEYDIESIKQMLAASGGDLESTLHQIVTEEGIEHLLAEYGAEPTYWAAAASLTADPDTALAYLKEAVQLHPESRAVLSALVGAQIAAGTVDESTLAHIEQLRQADPTNALGDCYAAYCEFEEGNIAGALQSLAQANAKGRFSDDRIGMLMARYDCLLAEGVSDAAALGLSAFTLPLEHLGMVRQLEQQSIAQAQSLSAAGQLEQALTIAQDVAGIGRTLSSSGRFLLYDRVGIALQQAGLAEQLHVYKARGDVQGIEQVDAQLRSLQERSDTIETMVQGFGAVMANMTEQELAGYVDGTILHGEFATLQKIPEIAEALSQTQSGAFEASAATPLSQTSSR